MHVYGFFYLGMCIYLLNASLNKILPVYVVNHNNKVMDLKSYTRNRLVGTLHPLT